VQLTDAQSETAPAAPASCRSSQVLHLAGRSVSLWSIVVGVVAVAAFWSASGPLDDPDVWWHVRLGRQIITTHSIPRHETWSFAALGHTWTPTAWLSDVVYGATTNAFGWRGLIFLKLIVCVVAALLLWRLIRRAAAGPIPSALAYALTLLPMLAFLRERPQAFSLLFVIWIAAECHRVRRGELIRPVPFLALQWLWANVHGMWFVGPAFVVVAAVSDLVDNGRPALPRLRRHAALGAGAVVLAACTPAGPRVALQSVHVVAATKLISEWQPTVLWQRLTTTLLLAICLMIVSFTRRTSRATTGTAVWVVAALVFALVAARNVAPAVVLLAIPLAAALDDLITFRSEARVPLWVPSTLVVVGLAGSAVSAASESPIDSAQPVRLVHELGALPAPRHVLNDYNIGGLITGLQPRASVAIDGRTDNYDPGYITEYFAALGLHGRWQRMLLRLDPDSAMLSTNSGLTHVLVAEYGWHVVDTEDGYSLLERGPDGRVTAPSS
jgi:hypothetical protein